MALPLPLKQLNSISWSPLNFAFTSEPVRIIPGDGGYEDIFACELRAERVRQAGQREFAAQYGARCGTATFPPIEEILTIRPPPHVRISGRSVKPIRTAPKNAGAWRVRNLPESCV